MASSRLHRVRPPSQTGSSPSLASRAGIHHRARGGPSMAHRTRAAHQLRQGSGGLRPASITHPTAGLRTTMRATDQPELAKAAATDRKCDDALDHAGRTRSSSTSPPARCASLCAGGSQDGRRRAGGGALPVGLFPRHASGWRLAALDLLVGVVVHVLAQTHLGRQAGRAHKTHTGPSAAAGQQQARSPTHHGHAALD